MKYMHHQQASSGHWVIEWMARCFGLFSLPSQNQPMVLVVTVNYWLKHPFLVIFYFTNPKKPQNMLDISTTNYFYKGFFSFEDLKGSPEVNWWCSWWFRNQVVAPVKFGSLFSDLLGFLHRGFLSSTGYLCFLCGISSKSRMTVAHRMTGYHDAANGKPMVTCKVSPPIFFWKKTSLQLSGTSSETLKSLTLPNQKLHLRDSYEQTANANSWIFAPPKSTKLHPTRGAVRAPTFTFAVYGPSE